MIYGHIPQPTTYELTDEITSLRRWKSTNAPRIEALEGLLSAARIGAEAGREAIATLEGERAANALLTAEIATLRAQLVASEALAERMKIRADTFEAAYNVANRATFQPHNAHWDATGGSGKGCLACQAAREAREQCDDILRAGLQSIAALAEGEAG